jgi:hypothetical protein
MKNCWEIPMLFECEGSVLFSPEEGENPLQESLLPFPSRKRKDVSFLPAILRWSNNTSDLIDVGVEVIWVIAYTSLC